MNGRPLLKISEVDVHYGEFQAIWNVSISIDPGRIVSIIGANGAGKSTLLRTIAGLMNPSRGTIEYRGRILAGQKPYQTLAEGIAMVPEGRRIFPRLTVEENLLMGAYTPRARKNIKQTISMVHDLFPILKERSVQMGQNLSGGEQQMLAIGRALMSEPKLILFDEISLGLAPVVIKDIYEKVGEINNKGITIVLVEQDIQRSLKAAHTAYVLLEGKVVLEGAPETLTEEEVKKAYFGL